MISEWLHYALRLFHLIAGIMWIGTSFYFVWLDGSFQPLPQGKEGVLGETYMVHGGFFYRVEKQQPTTLPKTLHWFKYEALLTWVSGIFLLLLVYWSGGGSALYVPGVHPHVGKTISVGVLVLGWLAYDSTWKFIGTRSAPAALATSLALLCGLIFGLSEVFPGRAMFIHAGATLGTIMVANVWMRILPAQRRMIAARLSGKEPDWNEGVAAKHRSLHNSYVTIPVLFTMISNHFSFVFDHRWKAVLLLLLFVVGASIRHLMITLEKQQAAWWSLGPLVAASAGLVAFTWPAPPPVDTSPPVALAEVTDIVARRCRQCHSSTPTDDVFHTPPNGVTFESPASLQAYAPKIRIRVVEARTMPLANETDMTEEEREIVRRWIDQGAKIQ